MTTDNLKDKFDKESLILTVEEIGDMLAQPTAIPLLIKNFRDEDIITKADSESSLREVLKFKAEKYKPLDDGRTLTCKDFWLQVAVRDGKNRDNLMMALKFMDLQEGRYDVSSPFIAAITRDISYRPAFGHHIIERFGDLTRGAMKILKMQP